MSPMAPAGSVASISSTSSVLDDWFSEAAPAVKVVFVGFTMMGLVTPTKSSLSWAPSLVASVSRSAPQPSRNTYRSFWFPPTSESLSAPPSSRSSPVPPRSVSFPAPPSSVSLSAPPSRVSAPPPPMRLSLPGPPKR